LRLELRVEDREWRREIQESDREESPESPEEDLESCLEIQESDREEPPEPPKEDRELRPVSPAVAPVRFRPRPARAWALVPERPAFAPV